MTQTLKSAAQGIRQVLKEVPGRFNVRSEYGKIIVTLASDDACVSRAYPGIDAYCQQTNFQNPITFLRDNILVCTMAVYRDVVRQAA